MTLKNWIASIFVLTAIISICWAEEPDEDLVREKRFFPLKHHMPHGHHKPHHGHHTHHHGHHHHKFGKHKLHKRNPLQQEPEILEERLEFENPRQPFTLVDIEDPQNDAKIIEADNDEVHPKSGPFIDVWSKKQKSKIFHGDSREANMEKRHFHHQHKAAESAEEHHHFSTSSHHFHETEHHHHHHQPAHHNPSLPNPHLNEPFHFEQSHFGHGSDMHHHTPIQKPSHGLNFESSHALKGLHGDGIVIQKHLKINKFRSAGNDDDDDDEDENSEEKQDFDHVDGIGVFGSKP